MVYLFVFLCMSPGLPSPPFRRKFTCKSRSEKKIEHVRPPQRHAALKHQNAQHQGTRRSSDRGKLARVDAAPSPAPLSVPSFSTVVASFPVTSMLPWKPWATTALVMALLVSSTEMASIASKVSCAVAALGKATSKIAVS